MIKRKIIKNGSSIGSFKVIRLMGTGGMGEMYEAHDEVLNRRVAIKRIASDLSSSAEVLKIFTVVGQIFTRLNHPHVVLVHSLGEHNGTRYMVMEYVEGSSLHDLIKQKGALSANEAVPYFLQTLEGVHALHEQGLIHQDIKPKNIILSKENTIKIVDFGIGKVEGRGLVGAIHYLAPELIEGDIASPESDIWSLGVNFYEALTGIKPFQAEDAALIAKKICEEPLVFPETTQNRIPMALQKIILKMCEKDPADRYHEVTEVLQDLLRLAQELPTAVVSKKESPKNFYRMALGVSLAVLGAGWVVFSYHHKSKTTLAGSADSQQNFPEEKQKVWVGPANPLQFARAGISAGENIYLQVSGDMDFQNLAIEEAFSKSPFSLAATLTDGKYYWRLVEKADDGIHPLFEGISFTVMTAAPPALMHPADRRVSPETNPIVFYWLEKTGFEKYRVQISSNRSFENLFQNILVMDTKSQPIAFPPGDYFWRIRGEDSQQRTSNWSEVRSLRIHKTLEKLTEAKPAKFDPPPVAVVTTPVVAAPAPPVAAKVVQPPPAPVVKAPVPEKKPRIVMPKPIPKSAPIKKTAAIKAVKPKKAAPKKELAFVPPPPVPVRKTAAVETSKIQIEVPKLKMPPDGASIVSLNELPDPISFKWQEVPSAQSYRLEVSADPKFKKLLHSAVLADTQTVITKKMPKGRIYWRLRAQQGADKSDWSATFSFEVGG